VTTGGPHRGLRERKKQATRRALQCAGLRLALDHGAEHVTIEMICEAAGVSPRTFFNYFPGKDDALVGEGIPDPDPDLLNTLATGDSGLGLTEDLRRIVVRCAEHATPRHEELMKRRELMHACPALLPRHMAQFTRFERTLAEAIATRTGTDPDHDAVPILVGVMTTAAMRASFRRWVDAGCTQPLTHYLDEAFAVLRDGPLTVDPTRVAAY